MTVNVHRFRRALLPLLAAAATAAALAGCGGSSHSHRLAAAAEHPVSISGCILIAHTGACASQKPPVDHTLAALISKRFATQIHTVPSATVLKQR